MRMMAVAISVVIFMSFSRLEERRVERRSRSVRMEDDQPPV